MKCPSCETVNAANSKFCVSCGASLIQKVEPDEGIRKNSSPRYVEGKNPVLATILSLLITSSGQFYNGDILKGITMVICFVLFLWTGPLLLLLPVWSAIDAYNVAKGNWKRWT